MSNDEKRPLGKILLQRKLVSQQELDRTLLEQTRGDARPLASHLISDGAVDDLEALRALSEQHGVPGIDLTQVAILLEHLDVVPREVSESHRILPVLMRGDRIFLAMSDPNDKRIVDELEFVTGKKVYPYVAVSATIDRTIADAYDARGRGESYFLGPRVPAETLRQLGLPSVAQASQPSASSPQASVPPTAPRRSAAPPLASSAQRSAAPPSPMREREVSQPSPAAVVVDDAMERATAESEISTTDFGNVDSDVSSVSALPEELRARATAAAGAVTATGGKLVLVVDDEDDIRRLLRRLLTEKGFRVIEADRGLLALRLVKEHVPDLIVLDAMLPELHGFDIARRIKGSQKYGAIPIVMISAVYRGWRIAEDLKASYGIEEYVEKPFRIADVMAAISRAFAATERGKTDRPEPIRDPEAISAEAERALNEGVAAYKAGELDRAIDHLKRGVGIDPLAYRLHFHLALLLGKKGLIYEAIQELERAVDLNSRHFPALKNLAVLYEKAGFKHKAVEMWERCVNSAPDADTKATVKEHLVKLL